MKKVLIVVLSVLLFCGTAGAQEMKTEAEASAVYAPQIESKTNSVSPQNQMALPYVGHVHGSDPTEERKVVGLPWNEVSVDTISPQRGLWDFIKFWEFFGTPYESSVWYKEAPNDDPIRIITNTNGFKLLGEIQVVSTDGKTPLEAVRTALYGAKKEMNAKYALVSVREFPVRNAKSRGLGGSSGGAFIGSDYRDVATVGGSGLISNSTGWSEIGNDVIVSVYTRSAPATTSTTTPAKTPATQNSVGELKRMIERRSQ